MQNLLGSPRFQGILLIGALQALVLFNLITSVQGEGLILIVQSIIAGAVAVGSLDRVGKQA